jgi:hypothetical protein
MPASFRQKLRELASSFAENVLAVIQATPIE